MRCKTRRKKKTLVLNTKKIEQREIPLDVDAMTLAIAGKLHGGHRLVLRAKGEQLDDVGRLARLGIVAAEALGHAEEGALGLVADEFDRALVGRALVRRRIQGDGFFQESCELTTLNKRRVL